MREFPLHTHMYTRTHIISIFVRMFWFSLERGPSHLTLFWHTSPRPYLFACALPGFSLSVCSRPGGASSSFPRSACHVSMPSPDKTSTFCAISHSHGSIVTATTHVLLKASRLDNLSLGLLCNGWSVIRRNYKKKLLLWLGTMMSDDNRDILIQHT